MANSDGWAYKTFRQTGRGSEFPEKFLPEVLEDWVEVLRQTGPKESDSVEEAKQKMARLKAEFEPEGSRWVPLPSTLTPLPSMLI
eukprot:4377224-Pyramimonas_sp.AAC.1